MQDLLGRKFSVGDGKYRVVDVRNLSGDLMIYAELAADAAESRRPKRAAFHYGDIATRLEEQRA